MITQSCLTVGAAPAAKRRLLWNGEKQAVGVGWVSPTGPNMSVDVQRKFAHSSPSAVAFHLAEPHTFVECGWQWALWWPAPTGTDSSAYQVLELAVRVDGPRRPGGLSLSLASPGDHHATERLDLAKYAPNFMNGQWHTLHIPLRDFPQNTHQTFDPKHLVQVIFGTWNEDGDCTVYLDDLALTGTSTSLGRTS